MTDTPVQPSPGNEFSRFIDIRQIDPAPLTLTASPEECASLARRFGLVAVQRLEARVTLTLDGTTARAEGRLRAAITQSCAISAEDLPQVIDEALLLRFVPASAGHRPDEELEITEDDCDEIEFSGTRFDLGEAVAQSLALAIDPFATGPGANTMRQSGLLGADSASPFAALAALKGKPKGRS